MSESSPLETLQNNLNDLSLSEDGKTLTDSNGKTFDATLKYTVPGTPDETAYSLASLYLLCLHPSLIKRKRACDKYGVQDNVKATHGSILLSYFGLAGATAPSSATLDSRPVASTTEDAAAKEQDDEIEDVEMMDIEMEAEESKEEKDNKDADSNHKESTSIKPTKKQQEDRRKKHHQKDKHRDRRRSSGKKDDKHKPKDKGPITNEQVMQNLTFLHGKRGTEGDSKRKSMELPSMDQQKPEMMADNTEKNESSQDANASTNLQQNKDDTSQTDVIEQNITDPDSATLVSDLITPPSKSISNIIHESEDERKARENTKLQEALASTNFVFSSEEISADREATEIITAMETPVGDSASVLRFASRDFSRVLGLYMEVKKNEERAAAVASSSSKSSSMSSKRHKRDHQPSSSRIGWEKSSSHKSSSSSSSYNQKQNSPKKPLGLPIIIVPNAMTSPIGMVNASDFFSKAVFTPRARNAKKASRLTFKRRMSSRLLAACGSSGGGGEGGSGAVFQNGEMEYEIIDNPSGKLSRSEWERVVAVIAHGEKWQFKNWKWKEQIGRAHV